MIHYPPAICLMGPTAIGKTDLALALAQRFPCEIISVDSAQVYKSMDIGTAKLSPDVLAHIPHHLIDICDPSESYSAAQFYRDALDKMAEIYARKNIPLLVGGTMLYFYALQMGLSPLPSANSKVRQQLLQQAQTMGWQALHAKLIDVDPEAASRIHPHDAQRISRALEIYQITGKNISEFYQQSERAKHDYRFINFGLLPQERLWLNQRIAERFERMLQAGFVAEVDRLFIRGDLNLSMPAIRAVGYRQVWCYLQGDYNYAEMYQKAIVASRQLAKRQMLWLRNWPDIHPFYIPRIGIIDEICKRIADSYNFPF